jgi:endo-1,4-beta-xylanase
VRIYAGLFLALLAVTITSCQPLVEGRQTIDSQRAAPISPPVVAAAAEEEANMQPPSAEAPLRDLAETRGRQIGAAVAYDALQGEQEYREVLGREFNMLTAENVFKFDALHPAPDRYDWAAADAIVSFAEAHGMRVRGHTLVWHNQLPSWVTEGGYTRDELIAILRDHIHTVVGHYRGRVAAWDVVNEAVNDDGTLRDTLWLRGIGPEYLDLVFQWAREADPDALLFYNDYGGEGLGTKSDAIYDLVAGMRQRGVPIDGVGLQMHITANYYPPLDDLAANIQRLGDLGLVVHITEMDVRIEHPVTEDKLAQQANVYRDALEVCLQADHCTAFVLWGFTDRHSWIPGFFPGTSAALIFDEQYQAKPAYYALREALAGSQ